MNILISFLIFVFAWLPVFALGLPTIAVLLCTNWGGYTTWFGNILYGRKGNAHTTANPTWFDSWNFLALRNPISNFGKFTLARRADDPAVWLRTVTLGRFSLQYGWKNEDPRLPGTRAFVFRPQFK